jgi:hypothetical protein
MKEMEEVGVEWRNEGIWEGFRREATCRSEGSEENGRSLEEQTRTGGEDCFLT